MFMHEAELLVRGQKVPIEQRKVVQAGVMWNVPCKYLVVAKFRGNVGQYSRRAIS